MKELNDKVETINNKEDFINFLELLIQDLKRNSNEWENRSLETYLGAIASWTEDMDGYYQNNSLPTPKNIDWKVFAQILIAAKIYE